MKLISSIKIITALAFSATLTSFALAHEGHNKDKAENAASGSVLKADAAGVSAEWLAKAKADYPTDACVVSGDKFDGGDMGKPQDYVYKQDGKPDRLVRFCCKDCVRDFKKDPDKYLKILDDAAAEKASDVKK
jgi:hypothetical protein